MTADLSPETQRKVALALLNDPNARLTRKAGSFCGQLVAEPGDLTEAQANWLATLMTRAGLSHLAQEQR